MNIDEDVFLKIRSYIEKSNNCLKDLITNDIYIKRSNLKTILGKRLHLNKHKQTKLIDSMIKEGHIKKINRFNLIIYNNERNPKK